VLVGLAATEGRALTKPHDNNGLTSSSSPAAISNAVISPVVVKQITPPPDVTVGFVVVVCLSVYRWRLRLHSCLNLSPQMEELMREQKAIVAELVALDQSPPPPKPMEELMREQKPTAAERKAIVAELIALDQSPPPPKPMEELMRERKAIRAERKAIVAELIPLDQSPPPKPAPARSVGAARAINARRQSVSLLRLSWRGNRLGWGRGGVCRNVNCVSFWSERRPPPRF